MQLPQSIIQSLFVRTVHFMTIGMAILLLGMVPVGASAATSQLAYTPTNLRFGAVVVGQTETLLATLTNNGQSSVTVSGIAVGKSEFTTSNVSLPLVLLAGQSVDLSVSFTPTAMGWTGGTIKFSSNASNAALRLNVAGTGVSSEPVTASPSTVSFGQVAIGTISTVPVVLTNARSWKVTLSSLQTTGGAFSMSGPSFPLTLGAGQSVAVNVAFSPQSAGTTGGELFVSGPRLAIPLTGTGTAPGQLTSNLGSLNFANVPMGSSHTQSVTLTNSGGSGLTVSHATLTGTGFTLSGLALPLTLGAGQSATFSIVFAPQSAGSASGNVAFTSNASNPAMNLPLSGTGVTQGTGTSPAWPALYGKVGAFDLQTPQEVSDMANHGFHLALVGYQGTADELAMALVHNNVQYIDSYPWYEISTLCQPQVLLSNSCTISSEEQQTLLDNIRVHFSIASHDSNVVGYWILDDYPGDIHDLLVSVHALLTEANKTSIFPRPTICGFGGILDWKTHISDTVFNSNTSYFQRSLINFDSNACDIVALYPYEPASIPDANLVDWSMTNLLPQMLVALEDSGWRQDKEPLIGIPQTFGYQGILGYVAPTGKDVSLQSAAYCKAGAIAVLAYAWDDSYQGSKVELFNSTDLVQGLQQGAHECQTLYWK